MLPVKKIEFMKVSEMLGRLSVTCFATTLVALFFLSEKFDNVVDLGQGKFRFAAF